MRKIFLVMLRTDIFDRTLKKFVENSKNFDIGAKPVYPSSLENYNLFGKKSSIGILPLILVQAKTCDYKQTKHDKISKCATQAFSPYVTRKSC